MPSPSTLQIEARLAAVHKHFWVCTELARAMGMDGLADDCFDMRIEVERLQEDLAGNARRRRRLMAPRAYPSATLWDRDGPA